MPEYGVGVAFTGRDAPERNIDAIFQHDAESSVEIRLVVAESADIVRVICARSKSARLRIRRVPCPGEGDRHRAGNEEVRLAQNEFARVNSNLELVYGGIVTD